MILKPLGVFQISPAGALVKHGIYLWGPAREWIIWKLNYHESYGIISLLPVMARRISVVSV